ncbi:MAG: hypothetical protein ACPG8W_04905 [Candidatus Promineifilaceae bacterium]
MINTNIANWLFLLLLTVTIISVVVTAFAWRQSKQSFHLYNRRSAEIRMQNYMTVTTILLMCLLLVGGYLWIETRNVEALPNDREAEVRFQSSLSIANLLDARATREAEIAALSSVQPTPESVSILPLEYRAVNGQANLEADAELTRILFSTTVSETYEPTDPSDRFPTDIETLFATFDYRNLANGLEWSWVWRRDGVAIDGGNEVWSYGIEGAAFVFLDPETFEPGDYSAEIWFNETLFARGNVTVFQSAADAIAVETNTARTLTVTTPERIDPQVGGIGRLPNEYTQLELETPISSQTEMKLVDFTVQYGGENRPVTLVAAFEHQEMADGMVWAWVWRRDNVVIGGGSRRWREPSDTRVGFMHFIPTEQLQSGEYSVELWVNETLLGRSVIQVTTSISDE